MSAGDRGGGGGVHVRVLAAHAAGARAAPPARAQGRARLPHRSVSLCVVRCACPLIKRDGSTRPFLGQILLSLPL